MSGGYECSDCGLRFDSPATWSYREDMNGEGAYQTFYVAVCPRCGSEEIEETRE